MLLFTDNHALYKRRLGFVYLFFFTFIEVQLIYNVVLITVVQQMIQYVYRHSFLYSFSLWFVIGY